MEQHDCYLLYRYTARQVLQAPAVDACVTMSPSKRPPGTFYFLRQP